jgi:hypothetical protein
MNSDEGISEIVQMGRNLCPIESVAAETLTPKLPALAPVIVSARLPETSSE